MPRRHAPATDRNREPILAVLRRCLPERGTVLEVASGSGQHAAYFSNALPGLMWQPSDLDPEGRESTDAWCVDRSNVRPAIALDASSATWPLQAADAIFCANMIHISPVESCEGLLAGSGRILKPGGPLLLYGPFRRRDVPTAPSNEAFDADLRARDPRWGLRLLEDVTASAATYGLQHDDTIEMPSNNLCVVYRRADRDAGPR